MVVCTYGRPGSVDLFILEPLLLSHSHISVYLTDIDDPIASSDGIASVPEPSAEQVSMLCDMGFTAAQAKKALRETVRP